MTIPFLRASLSDNAATVALTAAQVKELGAKLFAAAESGQADKVRELLSTKGIDINYRNEVWNTSLAYNGRSNLL